MSGNGEVIMACFRCEGAGIIIYYNENFDCPVCTGTGVLRFPRSMIPPEIQAEEPFQDEEKE